MSTIGHIIWPLEVYNKETIMVVLFNNRNVEIVEFHFERSVEDSFINEAYYEDTEENLTDEELDTLSNECQGIIYEEWFQHQVSRADFLDGDD